jgi:hypothetical protein
MDKETRRVLVETIIPAFAILVGITIIVAGILIGIYMVNVTSPTYRELKVWERMVYSCTSERDYYKHVATTACEERGNNEN